MFCVSIKNGWWLKIGFPNPTGLKSVSPNCLDERELYKTHGFAEPFPNLRRLRREK